MYTVYLKHIGKPVVDFILVLTELLQVLRLRRYQRILIGNPHFLNGGGSVSANFPTEWDISQQPFFCTVTQGGECLSTLSLTVFTQKKTLKQTAFETSALFNAKQPFCIFQAPFGSLQATYTVCHGLIGKPLVDFLLVTIELFRQVLRLTRYERIIDWRLAFLKRRGQFSPKFQVDGSSPTNHFSCQKTRQMCLLYSIR